MTEVLAQKWLDIRPETALARESGRCVADVETLIAELRTGRTILLVDDENRENEGDLVVASEFATAEAINFMATHGRGLICMALTQEMADQMALSVQPKRYVDPMSTNFTVSIEARSGVTSGISAYDRAETVRIATNPRVTPEDIATPGHIFPIIARPGGTLERPGHTEAAVDLACLAGLRPSGVICEVMLDDGTMARLGALEAFAQRFDLKVGRICDLVAYRQRTQK
ncbi:MAG: 3,4-dihydroxy-2-butanone-4-phosphate synthase [Alphaproteobacteria bacterium]|nr:3,4-dihydroxy-2-butanone-4-phosphate synthase [Alphaproteobacteria bacterium]